MMDDLEFKTGHVFLNKDLLRWVCLHPSAASVRERTFDFERLEFLGDRVLGLVIAEQLYQRFSGVSEGVLAHRLTQLVCQSFLVHVARGLGLDRYVRFSGVIHGQEDRILADACEALIGALYLDGSLDAARSFIVLYWGDALCQTVHVLKDPKSRLQEWTQGQGLGLPLYQTQDGFDDSGQPIFVVHVSVPSLRSHAEGQGRTKKAAQAAAAEAFLEQLSHHIHL